MSQDIVIDLTSYKDRMGSRVPEGRYRVVVEDAERDTSNAGNLMIVLYLRVLEGPERDATLVDRLTITDKSMFRVVGFLQGIGLPTPRKRLNINLRQFIGKVADVDVEDGDPFNGRVKSEVRGYLKVEGGNAHADEAPDLDDLVDEPEEFTEPEDLVDEQAEPVEAEPVEEPTQAAEALAQRVAATKAKAATPPPAKPAAKVPAAAAVVAEVVNQWGGGGDEIDLDELDL